MCVCVCVCVCVYSHGNVPRHVAGSLGTRVESCSSIIPDFDDIQSHVAGIFVWTISFDGSVLSRFNALQWLTVGTDSLQVRRLGARCALQLRDVVELVGGVTWSS